jgi:FlaA1/EpsC-like NDP-sugar epimerase
MPKAKGKVSSHGKQRVLIVGAGEAGTMIGREIAGYPEGIYDLVGFLDDDSEKWETTIYDRKVFGSIKKLPKVVKDQHIDEVLITIPSASGALIRQVSDLCDSVKVKYRILPGIFAIIYGDAHIHQIRDVEVEDLLKRDPITLDLDSISSSILNKRILITGAGGSIGSELCRQIAGFGPELLVLLGHGETSIYNIDLELRLTYHHPPITTVIGDIRDFNKLRSIFAEYRPHIVFHTAAHKHIDLMEANPEESVKNNILGTRNLAQLAGEFGVERFVFISTDKAVKPVCIMGATKKIAELIVYMANEKYPKTNFITLRFGNVLGSRGSVVEIFKHQLESDEPLTITHPDMQRYFMTIFEAVQLVIQAAAIGQGGDILILDMGDQVKIVDLANDLIRLSGRAEELANIKYVGIRKGERLREELFNDSEQLIPTPIKEIKMVRPESFDHLKVNQLVDKIIACAQEMNLNAMLAYIKELVPTYIE